jgi:predicted PurR-regulated permease PerM
MNKVPPGESFPFARRVGTVLLWTVLAGLAVALLVLGIRVLLAAFAGVLLAIMFHGLSAFVARHTKLSYSWAFGLVVTFSLITLGLLGWLLGSQIAGEVEELSKSLPQMLSDIKSNLSQHSWGRSMLQQAENNSGDLPAAAGGGVLSAFSDWSTYILTAVFVGLFAAANPDLYLRGMVGLFPVRHRSRAEEVLGALGKTLRCWLIGQGIAMVIIGASTGLMLWAFGVPLALVLALIVGLLGFIPYLGPIIGLVPVALMASTLGASTLLYVLLAYTVIQMLEGYVATPLIHKRMVYLPPVVTIIFQVVFGTVVGVIGFTLATPIAAVLLVLTRFYRRDVLGDADAIERDSSE